MQCCVIISENLIQELTVRSAGATLIFNLTTSESKNACDWIREAHPQLIGAFTEFLEETKKYYALNGPMQVTLSS